MEPEPKHLSPWIAWSLVILFAGIAIFVTWYYYNQASGDLDSSVTFFGLNVHKKSTTPAETTSTNLSGNTASWKTYTNTKYSYTIKYPKNFYLNDWLWDKANNKKSNEGEFVFIDKKPLAQDAYMVDSDLNQPYFEILATNSAATLPPTIDSESDTLSEITVAGQKAYKTVSKKPSAFSGDYITNIQFNHKGNYFDISWKNSDSKGTHDSEIDDIISSFQFSS